MHSVLLLEEPAFAENASEGVPDVSADEVGVEDAVLNVDEDSLGN